MNLSKKYILIVKVLHLLTISVSLAAQPRIMMSRDTVNENKVSFWVDWPECIDEDRNEGKNYCNPPKELSLKTKKKLNVNRAPSWQYFWEFGDGIYSRDSSPVHMFDGSFPQYDVHLRLTPIYSDNDEPEIRGLRIPIQNQISEKINSNFPAGETSPIRIVPHWHGAELGDVITFAISYRHPDSSSGQNEESWTDGEIQLFYPRADFVLQGIRWEPDQVLEELSSSGLDLFRKMIPKGKKTRENYGTKIWKIENLRPNEEHTFFVDLALKSEKKVTPDSFPLISASLHFAEEFSKTLDDVSVSIGDLTNTNLKVNLARDPNYMKVTPKYIAPGKGAHIISYKIGFSNDGKGGTNKVTITSKLDKRLNPKSLLTHPYFRPQDRALLLDSTVELSMRKWVLEKKENVTFSSMIPAGEDGEFRYSVRTFSNKDFRKGETINASADILFPGDSILTTNKASVTVKKQPNSKHSCCIAIKGGINSRVPSFTNPDLSGHLGLIFQKPLEKMKRHHSVSIPAYEGWEEIPVYQGFSKWSYQAEASFMQLYIEDKSNNKYNYSFVEVSPVQVRYALKLRPYRTVKSYYYGKVPCSKNGFIIISGGYKAAYLLLAKVNNKDWDIPNRFTDRIEHHLFTDFELPNLIKKPELSLGYRLNFRLNSVLSDDLDRYFQLYLRMNL